MKVYSDEKGIDEFNLLTFLVDGNLTKVESPFISLIPLIIFLNSGWALFWPCLVEIIIIGFYILL